MKLSIITVNLNNRDGLKRTIDSVISQTFTDYEWIVIDGGSTDGSRELIEQYSNHFAYWCSEPDNGIYNAMNKGIAHAQGEWLQFLNSGDWLYGSTTLERVFKKEWECDVIYGDMVLKKNNDIKLQRYPDDLTFSFFEDHTLCHQSSFYKKNIFFNNRYDENLKIASDLALYIQLILNGKRFKHANQFIVYFDDSGIGSQSNETVFHERYIVYDNYIPYHLREDLDYIKKWNLLERRKSFRFLHNSLFKLCKFLDKLLHKYEVRKK